MCKKELNLEFYTHLLNFVYFDSVNSTKCNAINVNMLKHEHSVTWKELPTTLDRMMAMITERDHKTKKKVGTDYCCYLFCRCVMCTDRRWNKHHCMSWILTTLDNSHGFAEGRRTNTAWPTHHQALTTTLDYTSLHNSRKATRFMGYHRTMTALLLKLGADGADMCVSLLQEYCC